MSLIVKIGADIRNFDREMRKLTSDIQGITQSLQAEGERMAMALTAPLAAIGATTGTLAASFSDAQGMMQAKLGLTAKEAEKLSGTAKELWTKGFGESIGDATNQIAKVSQNMRDIPSDQIGKVAEEAMTVAKVFDQDINEVTKSANSLMKNFGMSSTESFDLITAGFQDGLDYSGEFLDSVNEYSPQFKALGFSGTDMFNQFAAGAESGAFQLDKVGDAVKEFNIRAQDGSKSTSAGFQALGMDAEKMQAIFAKGGPEAKKSFQQVVEAISKIEDPVKRNAIGVQLFGTQFEDLEQDVMAAMGSVEDKFGDVEGATKKAGDAMHQGMGERFKTAFREMQVALEPLGMAILKVAEVIIPKLGAALQGVSEWFSSLSPNTQKFVVALGAILAVAGPLIIAISGIMNALAFVKGAFTAVGIASMGAVGIWIAVGLAVAALVAAIVIYWDDIVRVTTETWNAVKEFMINLWDGIVAKAKELWGGISSFFIEIWTGIKEQAAAIWNPIAEFFSGLWDGIKEKVTTAWNSIKETTMTIWNGIKDFFSEWGLTILAVITGPIGWIVGLIVSNWDAIKNATMVVWNAISSFLTTVWNAIVAFVSPIFNGIVSIITGIWNGVKTVTSAVWNFISQYLQALWTALMYFIQPIFDKIGSFISTVWNNIKTVATNVWNAIKAFLTTVWNGIKSIAETVWNALKSFFTAWLNAVKSVMTTVWNAIKSVVTTIWNSIKSVATSVWNALKSFFTAWLNSVKSVMTSVWNAIKSAITSVWNAIKSTATSVWNAIKNAVMGPINTLKSMATSAFNSLKSSISSIFNSIKSTAVSIWTSITSAVKGQVNSLVNGVKSAFNGMKSSVLGVWNGIKSGMRTIINGIISMINKFIGGFNTPAKLLNKIPGVDAPTIPKIPMLATGGTIFGNGQAIVGEAGPELVSKSGSSVKVTPLSAGEKARGIGGALGAGGSGVIEVPVSLDGKVIARVVAPFMDNELRGRRDSKNRSRGGW
ncbi:phage tail tape measure protein [Bacillus wiedmannii]|uniref:phage tail tape measure protein n=1 Tax=Bacillus wiedmannii TaxID=1890302 RepID=UPI000BFDFB7C|nr:phage tail tape measure protein [Bacillus wiedmannii]PHE70504.1 hypothetical protein COF77_25155 [Bacillus wiedmannii]